MAVPILDMSRQYAYLKDELNQAVGKVLKHGAYILGPEVAELERKVASLCGTKHAIGVASGTDALLLALEACGVKPGDEVITSNFSFFSSASVITRLGARPVLVDTEPHTYNMDPGLLEAAITVKTKVIMPVHLFGQMADMDAIVEIARRHGIKVVEDAAQAIGAEYKNRKAGSIGDFGCFSFYPTKNLGAAGDGGMIVCSDDAGADLCRILRVHGARSKYVNELIGYNSRLDTIQAAVLLVKLPHLRKWSVQRREHAAVYDEAFAGLPGVTTPVVRPYSTFHIYNQYTLACEQRSRVMDALTEAKIGFIIYYPVPFHEQPCFAYLGYPSEALPVSAKAARQVLSLPIYPELTSAEQAEVIDTVRRAVA